MKHTSHARGWALVGAIAIAVATALDTAEAQLPTTLQDFQLPGTQPLSGTLPLQASFICGSCHGGYSEAHSPHSTWASSMMAQAGRDPVFYAALAVANQDAANSGDLCLRCHAPGGWLAGRAFPTDGSNLDNGYDDFDGITCHFCHRMVDPVAAPENPVEDTSILAALTLPPDADFHSGQFVIDPNDLRRGPFDLGAGFGLHTWAQSPFHRDSGMCGTCHDVSNPAFVRQTNGDFVLDTVNQPHPDLNYDNLFPIERTYSEWAMSVYGAAALDSGGRFGGNQPVVQSCQDCHMPTVNASACMPGLGGVTRPDMPKHEFNGANSWVLRAIDATWPDYETALTPARITAAEQRTQAMMSAAADLEAFTDGGDLVVRVTNHTGHKLPSGYGEGRRMWIEVQFRNASGTVIAEHGAYDALTADLDTATTKVYEVVHGIDNYMATQTGLAAGPSFHFVLNNEVVSDNRIPPRGFDSTAFASRGAEPVATAFMEQQYWDDTTFPVPAGATQASVRLLHQTTSKEYIEFLRDENVTNTAGTDAYNLWDQFGKSAPIEMGLVNVTLSNPVCPAPIEVGLAKPTSLGTNPVLSLSGTPSASAGTFNMHVTGGMPGMLMVCFRGPITYSAPHFGGVLLVLSQFRDATLMLDGNGEATFPITVTPDMVGQSRAYQVLFRDNGTSSGIGMTQGLWVTFCE